MKNSWPICPVVVLLAGGFVSDGMAQTSSPRTKPRAKAASTAVHSTVGATQSEQEDVKPQNIIALRVTGPEDSWARASVIEGGALRVTEKATGLRFAFFPLVDTSTKQRVIIKVCQITKTDSGERLQDLETVGLGLGSSKTTSTTPQFKIEVEAIAKHIPTQGQPFRADKEKKKETQ